MDAHGDGAGTTNGGRGRYCSVNKVSVPSSPTCNNRKDGDKWYGTGRADAMCRGLAKWEKGGGEFFFKLRQHSSPARRTLANALLNSVHSPLLDGPRSLRVRATHASPSRNCHARHRRRGTIQMGQAVLENFTDDHRNPTSSLKIGDSRSAERVVDSWTRSKS